MAEWERLLFGQEIRKKREAGNCLAGTDFRVAVIVTADRIAILWNESFRGAVAKLLQMTQANPLRPEDILTPAELAKRLKVPLSWIYEKSRARGKHAGVPLPVLRLGRYLRFSWPDVCQWMRNNPS